jgi:hypothetical protein
METHVTALWSDRANKRRDRQPQERNTPQEHDTLISYTVARYKFDPLCIRFEKLLPLSCVLLTVSMKGYEEKKSMEPGPESLTQDMSSRLAFGMNVDSLIS